MSSKLTRILVVAAFGLFAFIFFIERKSPGTAREGAAQTRLLPQLKPAEVSSIELAIPTNQVMRVERSNDVWRVVVPVRYPAQATAIEDLLTALEELRQTDFISPQELLAQPGGLASYGLDSAPVTLILHQGAMRTELRIGVGALSTARLYVQVVGSQGVAVVPSSILQHIPGGVDRWRDLGLARMGFGQFDRLALRSGARQIEFEREPAARVWRLTKPMSARADNTRIEDFLRQYLTTRVAAFISDNPAADLEPYGLQNPDLEIVLGSGSNIVSGLRLGRARTNAPAFVHALRTSHTNVVLVPKELADGARALFTDFRDTRLATFTRVDVSRIELRSTTRLVAQRQDTNAWRLIEPLPLPADALLIQDLLATLGSLEISEFVKDVVTDYGPYGLTNPVLVCALYQTLQAPGGPTNRLLTQLEFGTAQGNQVYVRRSDEGSVYATALAGFHKLPKAAYQLRERRIWDFAATNVTAIEVVQGGRTNKLTRNAAQAWVTAEGPLELVEAALVEETVLQLAELRALRWLSMGDEELARYGLGGTPHRISLELRQGDKPPVLSVASNAPVAALQLNNQTVVFEIPARLYAHVLEYLTIPESRKK